VGEGQTQCEDCKWGIKLPLVILETRRFISYHKMHRGLQGLVSFNMADYDSTVHTGDGAFQFVM